MSVITENMIQALGDTYEIVWWVPGSPIFTNARLLGVDSETEYMIKGDSVKPVIAQVCDEDRKIVHVIHHVYWQEYFYGLYLNNPDAIWAFHNAPFDIKVLGDPRIDIPWMMDLLQNNRVVDTMIRFKLHELKRGKFIGVARLDYAAKTLLNLVIRTVLSGALPGITYDMQLWTLWLHVSCTTSCPMLCLQKSHPFTGILL